MKLLKRKNKKQLKDYITKENIANAKIVISELLEKKNELQSQISDFKEDIEKIKARKEEIMSKINEFNEFNEEDEKHNRVYAIVAEKRKKKSNVNLEA
ncbi:MAG: hypothetical protein ACRCX8_16175 [Sarcina sp.]